ncbi:cell division cycle-associated protein 7 isoform X2 [Engraulis encrasicolus]|uniref:cell division cycle-associated protein 7 isoform X2 n=1 Tax=Engraulis encrasicolus TaxID=184585 RepID=UPI002FD53C33
MLETQPVAVVDKRKRKNDRERMTIVNHHTEEESRDSLQSEDSGKADLCFPSKFVTDELVHIFMDTESEEEFEGFPSTDKTPQRGRKRAKSVESEVEDSDVDTGFDSDGERPAPPPRRRSSGLCVAFRFPIKKSSTPSSSSPPTKKAKTQAAAAKPEPKSNKRAPAKKTREDNEPKNNKRAPAKKTREDNEPKNNKRAPAKKTREDEDVVTRGQTRTRRKTQSPRKPVVTLADALRTGQEPIPVAIAAKRGRGGVKKQVKEEDGEEENREPEREDGEEEEEQDELSTQALNKRAKNIQENKAMLAKLFADLETVEQISPVPTPKKKKSPKKRASAVVPDSERRNPSRKARPREHFGVEEKLPPLEREFSVKKVDLQKLLEVASKSRGKRSTDQKRSKKNNSFLPVEDVTQDDLDNVADRPCDKILDKENGSTCHQCRQKTLDTKTACRSDRCAGVKGQFCGPCLRNRYGEDVRQALLDPEWECPICRGLCNCSICRKREGRCATGNLTHMAKHFGHGNVKQYLESLQKQL